MKIPFLNRPETRAGYSDLLVQAILQEATGSTTASVSSLGVVEACAGLWGRSFASATVTPVNLATAALTPAVLESIGRRLLVFGEAVFEIMVEDGTVMLVEASSWGNRGTRPMALPGPLHDARRNVQPETFSRPCATPAHRRNL